MTAGHARSRIYLRTAEYARYIPDDLSAQNVPGSQIEVCWSAPRQLTHTLVPRIVPTLREAMSSTLPFAKTDWGDSDKTTCITFGLQSSYSGENGL
jgi:hypothetical protein